MLDAQPGRRRIARRLPLLLALAAVALAAVLLLPGARDARAQQATLDLQETWNLVASPRTGTPEEVAGNMARVQSLHRWNPVLGEFESWRRGAPDFAQTLEHIERGEGLWVQVSGPVPWTVPPLDDMGAQVGANGFQLVGWVDQTVTAEEALGRLRGEQIFGWRTDLNRFETFSPDLPVALNTLDLVERGRAYWVFFDLGSLPPIDLRPAFTANNPVDVVPFDGSEVLVVEQEGLVRRFNTQSGAPVSTLMDLRDRVEFGGEQGLLSVALGPDFSTTGLVYVYYSVAGQSRTRLSRFTIKDGALITTSELILLQVSQPFPNHNGGRIAFGPDGFLYLGLGDGGSAGDPQGHGQNLGTLLGSIIRIDVDAVTSDTPYRIPDDNPFIDDPDARPEIYAYGLRNPWRMSFDPVTGRLWAGDVGQDRIEEINIIESGGNYGWNILEGAECFGGGACSAAGTILPVASYAHGDGDCSVTGGVVYRGRAYEELQGIYMYGDVCSGRIWGIPAEGPVGEPQVMATGVGDIVSFGTDGAGEVYVVTRAGQVFQVQPPQ